MMTTTSRSLNCRVDADGKTVLAAAHNIGNVAQGRRILCRAVVVVSVEFSRAVDQALPRVCVHIGIWGLPDGHLLR